MSLVSVLFAPPVGCNHGGGRDRLLNRPSSRLIRRAPRGDAMPDPEKEMSDEEAHEEDELQQTLGNYLQDFCDLIELD